MRAVLVTALIPLVLACADTRPEEPQPVSAPLSADHEHVLDVDWIDFPEDELHRSALAVVRGRVLSQKAGVHRTYPTEAEHAEDYAELPLTTSVVQIEQTLAARSPTPATIEIVQLGGRYPDGCWVEPRDQKLLRPGDEVVVFVRAAGMAPIDAPQPSALYSIIGGQQGLIPIVNGVIEPLPDTPFTRYAKRPVAELARDIALRGAP